MNEVFADACYWIALLLRGDELHSIAKKLALSLSSGYRIVTTDLVLIEFMDHASKYRPSIREEASLTWNDIRSDPALVVIPVSEMLLHTAEQLYHRASDKNWSLTDCTSFVVMRQRKITSALTHDHHFEQAGFEILM